MSLKLILLTFLISFLVFQSSNIVYAENNIGNTSYYMCIADCRCSDRFFIKTVDSSKTHFLYMLDRFMHEGDLMSVTMEDIEKSPKLWLMVLNRASFCDENEVYVPDRGCICENGKRCGNLEDDIDGSKLILIAVVSMGGILWGLWWIGYKLRKLDENPIPPIKSLNVK